MDVSHGSRMVHGPYPPRWACSVKELCGAARHSQWEKQWSSKANLDGKNGKQIRIINILINDCSNFSLYCLNIHKVFQRHCADRCAIAWLQLSTQASAGSKMIQADFGRGWIIEGPSFCSWPILHLALNVLQFFFLQVPRQPSHQQCFMYVRWHTSNILRRTNWFGSSHPFEGSLQDCSWCQCTVALMPWDFWVRSKGHMAIKNCITPSDVHRTRFWKCMSLCLFNVSSAQRWCGWHWEASLYLRLSEASRILIRSFAIWSSLDYQRSSPLLWVQKA